MTDTAVGGVNVGEERGRRPIVPLDSFDFKPATAVVFGVGTLERLGGLARDLGGNRVLIVTDPGIQSAGHVDAAIDSLIAAKLEPAVFSGVEENPTTRHVDNCVAFAKAKNIDLIVGLGGGSSIDTAKGTNFLLTNGGRMADYWGVGKATKPMLPMIAVPTTAGTGSEAQSFALIADEQSHQKMACGDKEGRLQDRGARSYRYCFTAEPRDGNLRARCHCPRAGELRHQSSQCDLDALRRPGVADDARRISPKCWTIQPTWTPARTCCWVPITRGSRSRTRCSEPRTPPPIR